MNKQTPHDPTRLLRRRGRALERHLHDAIAGDIHGVHRARVATRRLREAVPVLAIGLKQGKPHKIERTLRKLTRALGGVRELDVTLLLLDELAEPGDLPRVALDDVRAHVTAERDRRRAAMLVRLDRVNVAKLGRRLSMLARALEVSGATAWRDVLGTRLVKRARTLTAAIDGAGQLYVPENLHAVRIAAKKLRYALELASDSGTAAAVEHVRAIKRTQALLGRLHDLQILQAHVADVQAAPASGSPGMDAAFDALSRHIEDACRHLHGRYLGSAAGLRDLCHAVPAAVVPRLDVPGARRPLKMRLVPGTASAAAGERR